MALGQLPSLNEQADRLVSLGITALGGLSPAQICTAVSRTDADNALLVVHPDRVSAFELAPFLKHRGKSGFVVDDMADVDQFIPIDTSAPPAPPLYLVHDINRGDEMTGWSPDEALPTITAAGRTPLTLVEGIHWLLQQPEVLERSHCFMTIGSRLRRPDGTLDPRTPGLWISNGTGRDGGSRRHAPKVGWCWAGNRHSWLGFASAARRSALIDGSGFAVTPLRSAP
jgi:Family of unknown function (DUF5701)